jgi:Proline-rich nuclear receptor coactivator motif
MRAESDRETSKKARDEVQEATAALKGLLGIGGITKKSEEVISTTPSAKEAAPEEEPVRTSGGANKVSKPKKGKNNTNAGTNSSYNYNSSSGNNNVSGNTRSNNTSNKKKSQYQQQPQAKQQQSDRPKENTANANRKSNSRSQPRKKQEADVAFAWSKFQSSPDASKLPIPSFSSPDPQPVVDISTMPLAAEAVEGEHINKDPADEERAPQDDVGQDEVKKAELLLPAILTSTPAKAHNVTSPVAIADPATDASVSAILSSSTHMRASNLTPPNLTSPTSPVSKTGVDLAALTSKLSETRSPVQTSLPMFSSPQPPLPPPNAINAPGGPPPPHLFNPSMMYPPHGPPPPHLSPSGYNMPPPPPHHMNMTYTMPPPPGYVTVQVQVPAVLLPGRNMIVTSPAGYAVQVMVPAHVPPGAVIPVHVPADPAPMHYMQHNAGPYYPPPPHLRPHHPSQQPPQNSLGGGNR